MQPKERQPVQGPSERSSWWALTTPYRDDQAPDRAMQASSRLLQFAAGLEPGAHLRLVLGGDGAGEVTVRLRTNTTTKSVANHLPWIAEGVGTWQQLPSAGAQLADPAETGCLFELVPTVQSYAPDLLRLEGAAIDDARTISGRGRLDHEPILPGQ